MAGSLPGPPHAAPGQTPASPPGFAQRAPGALRWRRSHRRPAAAVVRPADRPPAPGRDGAVSLAGGGPGRGRTRGPTCPERAGGGLSEQSGSGARRTGRPRQHPTRPGGRRARCCRTTPGARRTARGATPASCSAWGPPGRSRLPGALEPPGPRWKRGRTGTEPNQRETVPTPSRSCGASSRRSSTPASSIRR